MEETYQVNIEDLLSEAIVIAEEKVQEAAPGSEERERLVRERDLLFKVWLDVKRQDQELTDRKENKWRKILEGAKSVADIVGKVLQIGGSLAIAVGIVSLGHKQDYLSADDMKGLSMVEKLLVK